MKIIATSELQTFDVMIDFRNYCDYNYSYTLFKIIPLQ
jgi:hypothetical protein